MSQDFIATLVEASQQFENAGLPGVPVVQDRELLLRRPSRGGKYHVPFAPGCTHARKAAVDVWVPVEQSQDYDVCSKCLDYVRDLGRGAATGQGFRLNVQKDLKFLCKLWGIDYPKTEPLRRIPTHVGALPTQDVPVSTFIRAVNLVFSPYRWDGLEYRNSFLTYVRNRSDFITQWDAIAQRVKDLITSMQKVLRQDPRAVAATLTYLNRYGAWVGMAKPYNPGASMGLLKELEKGKSFAQLRDMAGPQIPDDVWEDLSAYDEPFTPTDKVRLWYQSRNTDLPNPCERSSADHTFRLAPADRDAYPNNSVYSFGTVHYDNPVSEERFLVRDINEVWQIADLALELIINHNWPEPRRPWRLASAALLTK